MGNAEELCGFILFRVICRMKERFVWLKINEDQEAIQCLSVEYWLAKQDDNMDRIKEILQLVHLLNDEARDLFYTYADSLAWECMKEELERYEKETRPQG